ncbi:hypothetical protein DENSPDRAFT_481814 [Dentipellis sp. KUC8613]|nr:hypothetical protein DENSPDRAFT_481814 [Dentipellis sp. KUC8613]
MDSALSPSSPRPPSMAGSWVDDDLKPINLETVPLTPNDKPLWPPHENTFPKPPLAVLAATDRGFHLWGAQKLAPPKLALPRPRPAFVRLPSATKSSMTLNEKMAYKTAQHLLQADLIDEFFGDRSRNRRALLPCSNGVCDFNPDAGKAEQAKKEPKTLARTLFWHGFWLFPLWFWGAFLLLFPRTQEHSDDSDIEKGAVRCVYCRPPSPREVEKKWALRCLAAVITLLCVIAFTVFLVLELTSHYVSHDDVSAIPTY